jgi:dolichol-phosphate mannosyltransferase
MALQVSLVIPTLNEAGNVDELLQRIERVLVAHEWEAIFVDDDSTDGTADLVRRRARDDRRVRCLQRVGRRGLSTACIEGALASAAPVVAVMDADLQHDESILPRMLQAMTDGAELVVATRYAHGGGIGVWDARRAGMSRLATGLARLVCKQPVSDPMSGYFVIRRDAFERSLRNLSAMGFKILLDILASAPRPLQLAEVPYTFRERQHGESKLDTLVVWDFGMLLADKLVGRYVPVRFIAFGLVGGAGVFVHMGVLAAMLKGVGAGFTVAQTTATGVAMVSNFALNNLFTYRDMRLRGWRWLTGLFSFVLACSVGAVANVGVASYLFESRTQWALAALAGVAVGSVWNYVITMVYTWGRAAKGSRRS